MAEIPSLLGVTGDHHGYTLGAAVYSPQDQPSGARYLMVQSITQATYYTLDGSTPSATNGFLLLTTQAPVLLPAGGNVVFKFLRAASGAILQYQWIK